MPLIQILSDKHRAEYEQIPSFNAQQRKHFFSLPASLKIKVQSFPSISNKVGFRLMFGYFLATKTIYSPEQFDMKDIRYLCNQYGVMPFVFDSQQYKSSTYTRHKQIILKHFAFQSFQPKIHNPLLKDAIREQIYSWEEPKLIISFILDWLEWRRIERPSYYNLQVVITEAIRERDRRIRQKFGRLLTPAHKLALDKLTEKISGNAKDEYLLTTLHKLNTSDSPTQIRKNIGKLEIIQEIYEKIQPVLDQLNLSANAIRHFGEIVQQTETSHVLRKQSTDLYFHLTTFCAYQRCIFEDWMARTFISVCKVAINQAAAKEKERLFQERKKKKQLFQQVLNIAENSTELLEQVRQITWMAIPAHEKEQQLQKLLPPLQEPHLQEEALQQIKSDQELSSDDDYYKFLAEQSASLQKRANPIIKTITFHQQTSNDKAAKEKTVNAWRHLYFTGTYDFSEENLLDSFNLLYSQNYELNID